MYRRQRHRHWSNHAYGLAVDLNPPENPYVGCGMSRDPKPLAYVDRSRHPQGHGHPGRGRGVPLGRLGLGRLVEGSTKDYMHFSWNGH